MSMEEMAREIRSLKEALAERDGERARESADADGVRSMLDEGFSKIMEAVRPYAASVSVKDAVSDIGERIREHPLASVSIALASGFLIGRIADKFSRCRCCSKE
jgi:ElaB/YqjD/DUF883 family membrane-anchored ribosome-binding protein